MPIEGEYERQPQVAAYLEKALERENIDVEVRGARGVPSSAKELERYDLVLLDTPPVAVFPASWRSAYRSPTPFAHFTSASLIPVAPITLV